MKKKLIKHSDVQYSLGDLHVQFNTYYQQWSVDELAHDGYFNTLSSGKTIEDAIEEYYEIYGGKE